VDRSSDAGGDLRVDVTVDLTDAGLSEPPSAGKSGYVLIQQDTSNTDSWTTVQNGADAVSNGDEITFNDVLLTNDREITIGTTDRINSPLGGAQIILRGEEGNENSVDDTSLDPSSDAGFAMLGPPETGGTYEDLASDTDPQLIEFDLPAPMIYTYDSAADGFSEVTGTQKGTAMENGRALLLFVFDDTGSPDADPLDPTLPITVENGSGPPSSNQSVSFSSSAQQWLFVANPFAVPFDLSSISTSGGSGVNSTAQVWDQSAGSYTGLSTGPSSDVVGVGQGFFLECSTIGDCPTQVTLQTSGRVAGDRDVLGYAKSAANNLPDRFASMSMQLTVESEGDTVSTDKAAEVLFYEKASKGWGQYDATKLGPLTRSYATVGPLSPAGDSMRRAAQVGLPWPDTTEAIDIPLELATADISGTATLSLTETLQADGWTVEVVDTKGTARLGDDETHTLSTEKDGYRFSLDGSSTSKQKSEASATTSSETQSEANTTGDRQGWRPGALTLAERLQSSSEVQTAVERAQGARASSSKRGKEGSPSTRFKLRITPRLDRGPSAPQSFVEVGQFRAKADDRTAVLTWTTDREVQNKGFELQRQDLASTDKSPATTDWSKVKFVESKGRPDTYQFQTERLEVGQHAFRLVQVAEDGATFQKGQQRLSIKLGAAYQVDGPNPNPVRNGQTAMLPTAVRKTQDVTVHVYDLLGRNVQTVRTGPLERQNPEKVRIPTDDLSSGTYFVRVRGETFAVTRRLTVVK
jgi:hypothetical protein